MLAVAAGRSTVKRREWDDETDGAKTGVGGGENLGKEFARTEQTGSSSQGGRGRGRGRHSFNFSETQRLGDQSVCTLFVHYCSHAPLSSRGCNNKDRGSRQRMAGEAQSADGDDGDGDDEVDGVLYYISISMINRNPFLSTRRRRWWRGVGERREKAESRDWRWDRDRQDAGDRLGVGDSDGTMERWNDGKEILLDNNNGKWRCTTHARTLRVHGGGLPASVLHKTSRRGSDQASRPRTLEAVFSSTIPSIINHQSSWTRAVAGPAGRIHGRWVTVHSTDGRPCNGVSSRAS
ncbi:hypothetical protein K402DRAFT_405869 [Aulographum hederae CBS 113979]|uniref:Uncharacterized protein n=1 Tax=Aulographum hederae CBS 113979 TaxID=1176131 RepID=A0A6G1GV25_9PEZI|nr:hypothetical protein K402DRAFT_405869 [Aulographum hederae CBS 113979]